MEENGRVSLRTVLIWSAVCGVLIVSALYASLTRFAPLVDWAGARMGDSVALSTLTGLLVSVLVLLPALLSRVLVRAQRDKGREPHPRAILAGLFILMSLGVIGASVFIVPPRGLDLFSDRWGWVPHQVLGVDWQKQDEIRDETPLELSASPTPETTAMSGTVEVDVRVGDDVKVDVERAPTPESADADAMKLKLRGFQNGKEITGDRGAACLTNAKDLLAAHDQNGAQIVALAADDKAFGFWVDCADTRTFRLGTAVHETVHLLDFKHSTLAKIGFWVAPDEVLHVRRMELFPRSEITEYLRPDEGKGYQESYLKGDSGDQDLLTLLSELNAYTHGLKTDTKLAGRMPDNMRVSSRDGLATQMYYTELYLRRAREGHPLMWDKLAREPAALDAIQRLWSRAERALHASSEERKLGINDDQLLAKVYAKDNIGEIERLFDASSRRFFYDR